MRTTFADKALGYKQREMVVVNPYRFTFPGQEARPFEYITREKDVRRRVLFDAHSVEYQDTIATIKTSVEGGLLREGSQVGIVTDYRMREPPHDGSQGNGSRCFEPATIGIFKDGLGYRSTQFESPNRVRIQSYRLGQ